MKQFFEHVETGHVEGKPLHIADPGLSRIAIITHDEFKAMPVPQLQALLRSKNLVVTGCPHADFDFAEGLSTLTSLNAQIAIQGEYFKMR